MENLNTVRQSGRSRVKYFQRPDVIASMRKRLVRIEREVQREEGQHSSKICQPIHLGMFDKAGTAPWLIGSRYATRLSRLRPESLGRPSVRRVNGNAVNGGGDQ